MKILLTNDDGYNSEGIQSLYSVLSAEHETYLIAPDRERSACSNILTMREEVHVRRHDTSIYSVFGYPADCVSLALHSGLIPDIDLVISGINHGPNLGDDVHFSGTVGAARTAYIFGKPGIAVSVDTFHKPSIYFNETAQFMLDYIKSGEYLEMQFININYPDLPQEKIKGSMYTFLSKRIYIDRYIQKQNLSNNEYSLLLDGKIETRYTENSDDDALKKGYISITPMTIDSTDYSMLSRKKK